MKKYGIYGLICLAMACASICAGAVDIIAHRGASWLAPENTLASVMLGWDKDADVEIDVYLTKDNRIVVIHDKTTKRTGDKNLKVSETNLAELRKVDVGRFKSEEFAGEKIPLLDEVIATIPAGRKLYVEIKCGPEILPFLEKVVDDSGKRSQIVIIAFDFDTIAAAKKLMPDIDAYWLKGTARERATNRYIPHDTALVEKVRSRGLDGLDVHAGGITREFAEAVRRAGLKLYVWTVDDPADAVRLADLKVDGITTNRPEWLRDELKTAFALRGGPTAKMSRVWPIVCQFGIGAILCLVGVWCGLRGGYLDLKLREDRRLLGILVAGYLFMLAVVCFFTFVAPNWSNGGAS